MQLDNAERTARLEGIYQRSLAKAQSAYSPEHHLVGPSWIGLTPALKNRPHSYRPDASLSLAHALLREGDEQSVSQASNIIATVLKSQEKDSEHPHRGNFLWLSDDPEITDLNAVQFYLRGLLPLLVEHGHQLSAELVAQCCECVSLALEEQARIDVAPTYTNIQIMALFSLLVGGQWLADDHFQTLGKDRWARWVHFTVQSGAPYEYSSPAYGGIDLSGLAAIHQYAIDPMICLQARLMYERFWLHLSLHLHTPTNQFAGPYCRCYQGSLMTGQGPVKEILWRETGSAWALEPGPYGGHPTSELPANLDLALTDHWLPTFVRPWLNHQQQIMPYEIREMTNISDRSDLTTYATQSYALGTASRTYSLGQDDLYIEHQANYLTLHYARPNNSAGWGVMFSRYVVNDQHFGTISPAPDRPPNAFCEQGNFAGIQLKNKAIALYALQPQHDPVSSLKTVIVFPAAETLDEVWINDQRIAVEELPQTVQLHDWIVITDGAIYVGIRALEHSCLGREAPIVLERGPEGELWLTIYNYRGPAKRFWDYASLRGAFWRGNLRAGYIIEVAERTAYPSAGLYLDHLRQAIIEDTIDSVQMRHVMFRNGGEELALDYDLWNTEPGERRLNGEVYHPPSLASPLAAQGDRGFLKVGQASLVTNPQPVWLIAQELEPSERAWTAVNPQDQPTPLRLETPCGVITAEQWNMGRLVWRAPVAGGQELIIDALTAPIGLQVPEGVTVHPGHFLEGDR